MHRLPDPSGRRHGVGSRGGAIRLASRIRSAGGCEVIRRSAGPVARDFWDGRRGRSGENGPPHWLVRHVVLRKRYEEAEARQAGLSCQPWATTRPIGRGLPDGPPARATHAIGRSLPGGTRGWPGESGRTGAVLVVCRRGTRRRDCRSSSMRSPGAVPIRDGDGPRRLSGFEIVIVDDGSTDRTAEILRVLAADYPELKGVVLRPGVGQSSATVAGIRTARGDWIATLDADLRTTLPTWSGSGRPFPATTSRWATRGASGPWSRRIVSRWANRVRNGVLGQSIRDTGCSVRIFPRAPALRLPTFGGVHRFLGPLLLREGCRLVQVPVGHRPRSHGRSHYNLWNRSIQVVVDLLGVAWLLRRPLGYRVVEAWDASEAAGAVHAGPAGVGASTGCGGLNRGRRVVVADDRLSGPGAVHGAVPGPVGGLGEEARCGRAGGLLVAQPAGGRGSWPTRSRAATR